VCDVVKDTDKEYYLRPFVRIGLDWKAGMTNNPIRPHRTSCAQLSAQPKLTDNMRLLIGNESEPKIRINDTLFFS